MKKIIRIICYILLFPVWLISCMFLIPYSIIKWAFNDVSIWAIDLSLLGSIKYYTGIKDILTNNKEGIEK